MNPQQVSMGIAMLPKMLTLLDYNKTVEFVNQMWDFNEQKILAKYPHAKPPWTFDRIFSLFRRVGGCLWDVSTLKDLPQDELPKTFWEQCVAEKSSEDMKHVACSHLHHVMGNIPFLTMLTLAMIIVFFATCFVKRKSLCTSCCNGRIGPLVPVNLLDNYENRKGTMLAFGVTVGYIMSVLAGSYEEIIGQEVKRIFPEYVRIIIQFFVAVLLALSAYPLFFLQTAKNRLFSSLAGWIYTFLWLVFFIFKGLAVSWRCYDDDRISVMRKLFLDAPSWLCLLLLNIKFATVFIKVISRRIQLKKKKTTGSFWRRDDTDFREEYYYRHVKNMFKLEKRKAGTSKFPYKNKPEFKYSARVLSTVFVSLIALYMICVLCVEASYRMFKNIRGEEADEMRIWFTWLGKNIKMATLDEVMGYINCAEYSFYVSVVLSFLLSMLSLMQVLVWYRRHTLWLRKGKKTWIPKAVEKHTLGSGVLMSSSLEFAGFQVAFIIVGFFLMLLILWSSLSGAGAQLILPLMYGRKSILMALGEKYWPFIVIAILVKLIQWVLVRCCFMQDKRDLTVDNRQAFHITTYFLFFFNVLVGLVSCLIRIGFWLKLAILFLARTQKSFLPPSFERRDPGFVAYLGYLLMEHQHTNPVLQVFCHLLIEGQQHRASDPNYGRGDVDQFGIPTDDKDIEMNVAPGTRRRNEERRRRIIRRWQVAALLVKNPLLAKLNIKLKDMKKQDAILANGGARIPRDEKDPSRNDFYHHMPDSPLISGKQV